MFERFWKKAAAVVAPPASFEAGAIRSLESAEIELRHPVDGAPLGAFFTLAGPTSQIFRQARIDIARAQRDVAVPDIEASVELLDEASTEFLARIVLGWRGIKDDGAELPWSPEAARRLFNRPELRWMVNQLLAAAARTENFIEASATS